MEAFMCLCVHDTSHRRYKVLALIKIKTVQTIKKTLPAVLLCQALEPQESY